MWCSTEYGVVERYLARYVAGNKAFKVCKEYLFTSSTASTSSCLTVRETVEGRKSGRPSSSCVYLLNFVDRYSGQVPFRSLSTTHFKKALNFSSYLCYPR
ncbi:uncharacterized protein LAJ45_09693 [Morchella importuna]|uniref:uncharacterized protein n=1 Tax=Morchella importuna TaxID=1174673 RepID=UPI001E8D50EB|nr:uncharacterized protein LAJ45_09693 [Morchella importuna]KAH8146251.1 hypothetical protein LAJ45_09693 [Morchella importuna]